MCVIDVASAWGSRPAPVVECTFKLIAVALNTFMHVAVSILAIQLKNRTQVVPPHPRYSPTSLNGQGRRAVRNRRRQIGASPRRRTKHRPQTAAGLPRITDMGQCKPDRRPSEDNAPPATGLTKCPGILAPC